MAATEVSQALGHAHKYKYELECDMPAVTPVIKGTSVFMEMSMFHVCLQTI
jgi:hypothetical protein